MSVSSGVTMTKPLTLMLFIKLALNSSRTMSPAVWPLLLAPQSRTPWPLGLFSSGYLSFFCG